MLWTVNCVWVQLIGDDLFNMMTNASLFPLSFTLLSRSNNHLSSVKHVSLLGWAAVQQTTDSQRDLKSDRCSGLHRDIESGSKSAPLGAGRDKDSD